MDEKRGEEEKRGKNRERKKSKDYKIREKYIKGSFVKQIDDDISKISQLLIFKKCGENYFELLDWIFYI